VTARKKGPERPPTLAELEEEGQQRLFPDTTTADEKEAQPMNTPGPLELSQLEVVRLTEELDALRAKVRAFQQAVLDLSSRSFAGERAAENVAYGPRSDEVAAFTLSQVGDAGTRCGLWSAADFMQP
jgi:hypothetical protein